MKVLNINKIIRDNLYITYYPDNRIKIPEFLEDMNFMKNIDYKSYKELISLLYPVFYIVNSEFLETMQEVKESKEDEEDYESEKDLQLYDLDYIESVDTLLEIVENDDEMLVDILKNNLIFEQTDNFLNRKTLNKYKDKYNYFLKFSKLWFIDRLDYCHPIDKEELLFNASFIKDPTLTVADNRYFKLDYMADYIESLRLSDIDSYKSLLNSIMIDSYKYQKYLLTNHLDEKYKNDLETNIAYMENNMKQDIETSIMNTEIFDLSLDYFLEYYEQTRDIRDKVENYFSNKPQENKVLKK